MELENIVANTVYLKAREAADGDGKRKGRSRKWKSLMKFSEAAEVQIFKKEFPELNYDEVVSKSPIGRLLFTDYCNETEELRCCNKFLNDVNLLETERDLSAVDDNYEKLAPEEQRLNLAQKIYQQCLCDEIGITYSVQDSYDSAEDVVYKAESRLPDHLIDHEKVKEVEDKLLGESPRYIYSQIASTVRDYLSGDPFAKYVESKYFTRQLQWKQLEKKPIGKHTFRHYRVLGKGGFGEVCATQSRASGKMYAEKKLNKKRIKKKKGEMMALNEKELLEKVNSIFVVSLAYAYETKENLCMVLTLMNGGDLKFHIHSMGAFTEDRARFYTAEILCGIQHLHQCNIVYRDLKPENILLDDAGHVRISDLGLAIHVPDRQVVKGRVGTVGYMAPEVIKNERYSYSVDWWGLGCIIFEMIEGQAPFRSRKERVKREEVEKRILDGKYTFSDKFSEDSKEIVRQFLELTPATRLGVRGDKWTTAKQHKFFEKIDWIFLEAGSATPDFVPDPHAVYAKDVLDIEQFSTVKGIVLDEADEEFYRKFATGSVAIPWQDEIIEVGVFKEINVYYENDELVSPKEENSKKSLLDKIPLFRKKKTTPPNSNSES
ncbi:G protein-coupled receptor kinase 5-like isoform X4 [Bolinopsis microptera]|uniref:G protein-coupled receptor kinase 5-like isoform X4 n=1 Tax=Bolinopsis microptera TaxID=2820187 RepID=UPI003078D436